MLVWVCSQRWHARVLPCRCQVAGDYFGINSDTDHNLPQTNLFDLMEAKGISYKGYMEAYPGVCLCLCVSVSLCLCVSVCVLVSVTHLRVMFVCHMFVIDWVSCVWRAVLSSWHDFLIVCFRTARVGAACRGLQCRVVHRHVLPQAQPTDQLQRRS